MAKRNEEGYKSTPHRSHQRLEQKCSARCRHLSHQSWSQSTRWTTKYFLPADSSAYPQILPHILWCVRKLLRENSKQFAEFCGAIWLELRNSYRKLSVRFPVEFRSEITANTREMFVVVKLSLCSWPRPCSSKHNTRFQWSDPLKIKFLAFAVVTRRFHPSTWNTMRAHSKTAAHQLVRWNITLIWNSSLPANPCWCCIFCETLSGWKFYAFVMTLLRLYLIRCIQG